MPKEKEENDRDAAQEAGIDREVLDVIQDEKRKGSARGPKDVAAQRKK
jgi:hypothetical protein